MLCGCQSLKNLLFRSDKVEYRVKHKETGKEKRLSVSEVNDMVHDDTGQVIVFDMNIEVYFLMDEEDGL